MPTLIRLLGNSAVNNTEVRNTFRQPVLIPAGARIALTGVNAVLADDLAYRKFAISGNSGQFNIGLTVSGGLAAAVIPDGEYSMASFVDAMEVGANYTGTSANADILLGVHHDINVATNYLTVGSRLSIDTYYGPMGPAEFTNWTNFSSPAAVISDTSFTATATAASETVLVTTSTRVPLVSSKFQATFVNADTVDMQIGVCSWKDYDKVYWGLKVETAGTNRQYKYGRLVNDATVWTNITGVYAQANDVVTLSRYGDSIRVKIVRSGGTVASDAVYSGVTRDQVDSSKDLLFWYARASTGGQMSNCQCTQIEGVNPPPTSGYGLNTVVNARLNFFTTTGQFNSILAMYCGFQSQKSNITYSGDPAHLSSWSIITGIPAFPGILVTIDGLGILKSFDGASSSKSPSNIIYSVNEMQEESHFLQLDVPQPLYLDIGNPTEINVNELRVKLYEAAGYNQLSFLGNPSFSFIIAYPKA